MILKFLNNDYGLKDYMEFSFRDCIFKFLNFVETTVWHTRNDVVVTSLSLELSASGTMNAHWTWRRAHCPNIKFVGVVFCHKTIKRSLCCAMTDDFCLAGHYQHRNSLGTNKRRTLLMYCLRNVPSFLLIKDTKAPYLVPLSSVFCLTRHVSFSLLSRILNKWSANYNFPFIP